MILCLSAIAGPSSHAEIFGRINNLRGIADVNHSHVSNAIQDDFGFIWFATWNGLVRYDGERFHYFKPILSSEGEIDSNRLYNLKQLGNRYIWSVSSDNRLHLFDRSNSRFVNLTTSIPEISLRRVKSLTPLKDEVVYVVFRDNSSIRFSDTAGPEKYRFFASPDLFIKGSSSLRRFAAAGDDEWVITEKGAFNLSDSLLRRGDFLSVESVEGHPYLVSPDASVTDALTGKVFPPAEGLSADRRVTGIRVVANNIVLGTDRGIESVALPSGERRIFSTVPSIYIFKDSRSRIWSFGNDEEIVMIPDVGKRETVVMSVEKAAVREEIKNPQLIHETREGNIVLKTAGGVLSYFNEEDAALLPVRFYQGGTPTTFTPNHIKKYISDSHGNLWIIRADGTDCVSFHRERFKIQPNDSHSETRALLRDSSGSLWRADGTGLHSDSSTVPLGSVYCLRESPDGEIWAGTKGTGLYRIAHRDNPGNHIRYSRDGIGSRYLPSDSIYDIVFDSPDRVWLASFGGGLILGERQKDSPGRAGESSGEWRFLIIPVPSSAMKIRKVIPVDKTRLILATTDGLVTADVRNLSKPRFFVNRYRSDEEGLKGNDIMDVVKVGDRYFACVFGSGLSEIVSKDLLSDSLKFRHYGMSAGTDFDQIRAAKPEGDKIWIMSAASISCFSTVTGTFVNFPSENFNNGVGFSEATPAFYEGILTVGTNDGILEFHTGEMFTSDKGVALVLSGIRYKNDMEVFPLDNPASLTLSTSQRSFSLTFSTMEYDDTRVVHLRYRLDHPEEGWTYVRDNHPAVSYSNIPPGKHKLIIETELSDGTWVEACEPIELIVTPRFTETVGFKVFVVLLVVLLFLGLTMAAVHFRQLHDAVQRKYSLLMTIDDINVRLSKNTHEPSDQPGIDKNDLYFLEESVKLVEANMSNPDFVVEDMAKHLGMSRTAYFKRMKAVTGLSPVNFIKQLRIKRALKLFEDESLSISEVAYSVGFEDPKYFSKCFKAEMMMTPSQYIESKSKRESGNAEPED